jgi:hypothetical protein
VGPVVRSEGFVFKNLHYCMLSYDFVVGKSKRVVERLSEWNVQIGAGHHRKTHSCMSQLEFNRMYFKASNVFQPISAPTSIPQAMHGIVRLLLEADTDSQIVELGTEQYFGEPTDGGSTEFYAWFVHNYGGHFVSIDSDPKVTRHAETELLARHGETPRTKLITGSSRDVQASDGQLWSLIHLSGRHNQGNEMNQVEAAIITLNDFIRVEPQLDETGLVVIDERREDVVFQGHSRYLVYYLLGRGYKPHLAGRFVIFARRNLVEA